jgi:hypothetical protein
MESRTVSHTIKVSYDHTRIVQDLSWEAGRWRVASQFLVHARGNSHGAGGQAQWPYSYCLAQDMAKKAKAKKRQVFIFWLLGFPDPEWKFFLTTLTWKSPKSVTFYLRSTRYKRHNMLGNYFFTVSNLKS